MTNKVCETYIVGMDGGIDSAVAAYLLKKQGHNPIGVAITFHEGDDEFDEIISPFLCDDLENIKTLCKTLEIPFYATNASELYFQEVVDKVVSSRIAGIKYRPNADRVGVILKTLIDKMKALGATKVATGHFCKILKNQSTGQFNLFVGNDLAEDDSYYLSKLETHVLEKLYFPLAELKESEVVKVSKLIPFQFKLDKKLRREGRNNFMKSEEINPLIEKYAASSLRKDGQVVGLHEGNVIGDHTGIHQFYLGQKRIPLKVRMQIDKELVVVKIVPSNGAVYVDKESRLKFTHVYLTNFICDKNLNRSLPVVAYAMIGARTQMHKCTVFFKNNYTLFLEFEDEVAGQAVRGEHVALYNKSGIGARVLGCGSIKYGGFYDGEEDFFTLPKTRMQEEKSEEVQAQKKKDLGF